jgi:hypothetical protein
MALYGSKLSELTVQERDDDFAATLPSLHTLLARQECLRKVAIFDKAEIYLPLLFPAMASSRLHHLRHLTLIGNLIPAGVLRILATYFSMGFAPLAVKM